MSKLFIFDVGGVLVGLRADVRREILYASVTPDDLSPADQTRLSETNRAFRLGFIAEDTFVATVTELLQVTPETLDKAESDFIVHGDPRMAKLAQDLRRQHRVICLSNTQPTHWRHVMTNLLGPGFFDREYVSHEMGVEKPDIDIYRQVAEAEDVDPADIVFLDDTADNLPPAEQLGWGTVLHHRSVDETLARLAPFAVA